MRIAKDDIPVLLDVPGATARQQPDFGDVTGYSKIGAEYFSFDAGASRGVAISSVTTAESFSSRCRFPSALHDLPVKTINNHWRTTE